MLKERYVRNVSSLSEEECAQLADKTVVIAGCGGLGGVVMDGFAWWTAISSRKAT